MNPAPDFAALAGLGPYFAVDRVAAGASAPEPPWRSVAALADAAGPAQERAAEVRAALEAVSGGPVEPRVAASTAFLALAARIVSPPLGLLATQAIGLTLDARDVLWRPVAGGPIPVAYRSFDATRVPEVRQAADALLRGVLRPVVAQLASGFGASFGLSSRVLWGNVASALAGAAGMIERLDGPQLALPAHGIAAATIAGDASLARSGGYVRDAAGEARFRRTSCCLFYRVAGGGLCVDCVLCP